MPEEAINPAEAALPSFVELLVPDPGKLPELQVLFGFPGRSLDDDLVRLYQSPALDTYVEVRRQDVIHSQRLERVLPEATIMWLPRDAQVVHGPPGNRRQETGDDPRPRGRA